MAVILQAWPNQLQIPKQVKPQGVPQIDWTHPLTRGLNFYAFDVGNGFYVDLVSGQPGVVQGSGTGPSTAATPNGAGTLWNAGKSVIFNLPKAAATSAIGSFAAAGFSGTSGQLSTGLANYTGSGNAYLDMEFRTEVGNNKLEVWGGVGGASRVGLWTTPLVNTYFSIGAAGDGANQSAYGNGQSVGSIASSQSLLVLGTAPQIAIGDYVGGGAAYAGSAFYVGFWDISLSAQEWMQLHLDPYCFLVPAEPEMMALGETFSAQSLRFM